MIEVHNFDQSDQQDVLDFSSPIEDPPQSKLAKLNENDAANEHSSGAGPEEDANEILVTNDETICPSSHVFVKDKTLPMNITHIPNRSIPKVVHFFVKSKCLPQDVALNVNQWMLLDDHSVLLHDYNEITDYLSKKRKDLPFVWKALNCAFQHETILDLARLVWLYDHGGISVDIDHIPGDGFLNGTLLDPDDKGTPRQFIIEDITSHPYIRFIASEPKHYALYGSLILSVAMQYRQHVFNSTAYSNYIDMRQEIYRHTVNYEFMGRDYRQVIRTMRSGKESIGIINSKRTAGKLLIQTPLRDETLASTRFSNENGIKICVDLNNDSYHVDTEALLNIIGDISDDGDGEGRHHAKCPDGQAYVKNTHVPNSFNTAKRKIPKVVHMTSKSNCFTKPYASNADLWRFEDYSFMMHDDAAVGRLFRHNEWPEFPLLKEILPCLTSGAMRADYWRYLVIWAFGGVYTDMDNAPGVQFKNGTIITDEIDAFFEVERSEVASQYFFARKFNCYCHGCQCSFVKLIHNVTTARIHYCILRIAFSESTSSASLFHDVCNNGANNYHGQRTQFSKTSSRNNRTCISQSSNDGRYWKRISRERKLYWHFQSYSDACWGQEGCKTACVHHSAICQVILGRVEEDEHDSLQK